MAHIQHEIQVALGLLKLLRRVTDLECSRKRMRKELHKATRIHAAAYMNISWHMDREAELHASLPLDLISCYVAL